MIVHSPLARCTVHTLVAYFPKRYIPEALIYHLGTIMFSHNWKTMMNVQRWTHVLRRGIFLSCLHAVFYHALPYAEVGWRHRWTRRVVANFWEKFGKLSLVFGCIGTDLCKKICVLLLLQHFSKSTRLSSWIFWNLATFCRFCNILQHLQKKLKKAEFSRKIADFSNRLFCQFLRLQRCKSMQIL